MWAVRWIDDSDEFAAPTASPPTTKTELLRVALIEIQGCVVQEGQQCGSV